MAKITYLDDLQEMQADHIWGKVRKMRKQKGVAKAWWKPITGLKIVKFKTEPYTAYRRKVAARFAGRAGRAARQLIMLEDY